MYVHITCQFEEQNLAGDPFFPQELDSTDVQVFPFGLLAMQGAFAEGPSVPGLVFRADFTEINKWSLPSAV